MSQRNGDRARADRKRKAKLHQRTRIREFLKVTQQHAPKSIDPHRQHIVDVTTPHSAASNGSRDAIGSGMAEKCSE